MALQINGARLCWHCWRTAAGTVVEEYRIPTPQAGARSILVIPGGRAFFSEFDAGQIGELVPEW